MEDAVEDYHGQDLKAAKAQAKKIGGMVIKSAPPGSGGESSGRGYWCSSGDTFIRAWETVEADYTTD